MPSRQEIENLDLETLMRGAIALAVTARSKGNHLFGALLCDLGRNVVLEAENTVGQDNNATKHAEQNLINTASHMFRKEELGQLVVLTSAEPCAMCAI